MAILSASELSAIRRNCASKIPVNYDKTQVNAIAQAIEDVLVSQIPIISSAIDAAISPVVLSPWQKKKMVAEVLRAKYERDK